MVNGEGGVQGLKIEVEHPTRWLAEGGFGLGLEGLHPFFQVLKVLFGHFHFGQMGLHRGTQTVQAFFGSRAGQDHGRRSFAIVRHNPGVVVLVEKREEGVIIFVLDRVVFVGMATGTLGGEAQKSFAKGVHPVGHVFYAVFLVYHASFLALLVVAVETSGQELIAGRVGQEVARELPGDEFVEGQVLVESPNHPVSVGVSIAQAIVLIAM